MDVKNNFGSKFTIDLLVLQFVIYKYKQILLFFSFIIFYLFQSLEIALQNIKLWKREEKKSNGVLVIGYMLCGFNYQLT